MELHLGAHLDPHPADPRGDRRVLRGAPVHQRAARHPRAALARLPRPVAAAAHHQGTDGRPGGGVHRLLQPDAGAGSAGEPDMNRRKVPAFTVLMAVILALMLIGVIRQATTNPAALILPLAVIGALLLMIKYPPSRWSRAFRRTRSPV